MKQHRYSVKIYSLRVRESDDLAQEEELVSSPEIAKRFLAAYFTELRDDRERMIALGLTSKLGILGITEVGVGGSSLTLVDPKVLFRTLLVMGACKFILAHNHPSGDPSPSREDLVLTKRIGEGGDLLGLQCLDHLIFGDGTNKVISLTETEQFPFSPLKHWGGRGSETGEMTKDTIKVGPYIN